MQIETHHLLEGAANATGVVVIIDVFRASTTTCYVMSQSPTDYFLVGDSITVAQLKKADSQAFLIGKPEGGLEPQYDIPNSPTLSLHHDLSTRVVVHRTAAGARGVLNALRADEVLVAGFVNVGATVTYIQNQKSSVVSLVCMGHEGTLPAPEDELCAEFFMARLKGGEGVADRERIHTLRLTSGAYFFGEAQGEYPTADFERCLEIDRFAFAVRAEQIGSYARLRKVSV